MKCKVLKKCFISCSHSVSGEILVNDEVLASNHWGRQNRNEEKIKNFHRSGWKSIDLFPPLFYFSLLENCRQNIFILYEEKIQSLLVKTYPFRGHGSVFKSKTRCIGQEINKWQSCLTLQTSLVLTINFPDAAMSWFLLLSSLSTFLLRRAVSIPDLCPT